MYGLLQSPPYYPLDLIIPDRWKMPWDVSVTDDGLGNYAVSPTLDALIAVETPLAPVVCYVDAVYGSNSNAGTSDAPWATIAANYGGISHIVIADILHIAPGVYSDYTNRNDHNCQLIGGWSNPAHPKTGDTIIAVGYNGLTAFTLRSGTSYSLAIDRAPTTWGVYDTAQPLGDSYLAYAKIINKGTYASLAAAVDATPHSWAADFTSSGTLYINTGGDYDLTLGTANALAICATSVYELSFTGTTEPWVYANNGRTTWTASTAYALNAQVRSTNGKHYYQCTAVGSAPHQSGSTEPTWVQTTSPITDGNLTWRYADWSLMSGATYTFQTATEYVQTILAVSMVVDGTTMLPQLASAAAVEAATTGGGWYLNPSNCTLYVNVGNGTAPDVNTVFYVVGPNDGVALSSISKTKTAANIVCVDESLVYLGGISMSTVGGGVNDPAYPSLYKGSAWLTYYGKSCRYVSAPFTDGFSAYGRLRVYLEDCISSEHYLSGYFFLGNSTDSSYPYLTSGYANNPSVGGNGIGWNYSPKVVLVNCIARDSSSQYVYDSGIPGNFFDNLTDGYYFHSYTSAVIVGCIAEHVKGTLFMLQAAAKVYHIGCQALGSVAYKQDWNLDFLLYGQRQGGTSAPFINPEAYYYNCMSNLESRYGMVSNAPAAGTGAAEVEYDGSVSPALPVMSVYPEILGNPTNPTFNTGSIVVYDPWGIV